MATSRIADHIGRVLGGRYRLLAPIGTGASAHVYLAEDVSLRRRVAVKVLHSALAEDESFLRRFRAEAQAVAALRHPHVMTVHDWGEDDDGPYLVLEHLGGGSLRDLLDRGERLTPSQALLVGIEAAQALDYAHRRGLVHRDIKPANLLFDEEGRLAIADFGLARALAEAAWTEPQGAMLGTARYASPEQAKGASVDGKSDVYSLALALVEAVTGTVPFSADTTIATLMARIDRRVEAPAELGPLGPVVEAATAPEPAERLDSAALVAALDRAATELTAPAPLPLAGSRTIDLTDDAPVDPTHLPSPKPAIFDADEVEVGSDPPRRRWLGRRGGRRWLKTTALVLVLLAMGAGLAYAVNQARIPSHEVPALRTMTVEQAKAEVAEEDFDIEISERQYDENIPRGAIIDQDPSSGFLKEGRAIKVVVSRGPEPRGIPDLAGMTYEEAVAALEEEGFEAAREDLFNEDGVPAGVVLDWSPREGRHPKGETVLVKVSKGRKPVPVPDLGDRSVDKFQQALEAAGFKWAITEKHSDTVGKGFIISTNPAPGTEAQPGSTVTIVVSLGPELVTVPEVRGMTVAEAEERLNSVGLKVAAVQGSPSRLVVDSNPDAGRQVKKGTGVTLITR